MREGPFETDAEESKRWYQHPFIWAITEIRLRQQTRQRWKPAMLAQLFSRFPRLRRFIMNLGENGFILWSHLQTVASHSSHLLYGKKSRTWSIAYEVLFKSLSNMKRFVLFENFNQDYITSIGRAPLIRTPPPGVSRAISTASLKLESLSVSFILDANHLFPSATEQNMHSKWPNLTSLNITSPAPNGTNSDAAPHQRSHSPPDFERLLHAHFFRITERAPKFTRQSLPETLRYSVVCGRASHSPLCQDCLALNPEGLRPRFA
jgi:hypothetical protein